MASTSVKNSVSGTARLASRSATICRPVRQVVIIVNSTIATTSGSQPPCRIFSALAPKNARSIIRKMPITDQRDRHRPLPALGHHDVEQQHGDDHRQRHGDAVGRGDARSRLPKPITIATVATINAQLTRGT